LERQHTAADRGTHIINPKGALMVMAALCFDALAALTVLDGRRACGCSSRPT
jgi:hypothetical protein